MPNSNSRAKVFFFHAPEIFPPMDFFYGLLNADVWIILDHVTFTSRSRQSRCRIKTTTGVKQLQVSIVHPQNKPINYTVIDNMQCWRRLFLREIKTYYGDAPYFDMYFPMVKTFIESPFVLLETLTVNSTLWIAEVLGKKPLFIRTSELDTSRSGRYTNRYPIAKTIPMLLERYKALPFNRPFEHPCYPQCSTPFEKDLSILDSLFCVGAEDVRDLLLVV